MNQAIAPAARLSGPVRLPADKSISHRAALLAALADGRSEIIGYSDAADPHSTLSCLRQLGISIEELDDVLLIDGGGLEGLRPAAEALDCGNSGTTMRLLAGILAGQPFPSTLVGDASLSGRPMRRIADPLERMNARLTLTEGHAPIHIEGNAPLQGITYELPVASAQVKSCVLLAGLYAEGETTVIEKEPSRDHTERMLGLPVEEADGKRHIRISKGHRIEARRFVIPRDFSAAAFFMVAGSIVPEGDLVLEGVGLNPTRNALLHVLLEMGANITVRNERDNGGEPIADLSIQPAALRGISLGGALIPNLIDEIPILAVAAACAEGCTKIRDAGELRVKETDRISAVATNLRLMGASVEELPDGLVIEGGSPLHGAEVDSFDDHRIAMSMAVAGLVASGRTVIKDADCARISFPTFWDELGQLCS